MPKSDYLKNAVLDHVLSATAYAAPATLYLALFTVAPTDAGGGTEVAGGAYARVAVTNNAVNFPAAAAGIKYLGTQQSFPTATADWGTIVAMAIFDAAAAGNMLYWANLTASRTVTLGDIARFVANSIEFTEN
jgi:hypothetical protein